MLYQIVSKITAKHNNGDHHYFGASKKNVSIDVPVKLLKTSMAALLKNLYMRACLWVCVCVCVWECECMCASHALQEAPIMHSLFPDDIKAWSKLQRENKNPQESRTPSARQPEVITTALVACDWPRLVLPLTMIGWWVGVVRTPADQDRVCERIRKWLTSAVTPPPQIWEDSCLRRIA